MSIKVKIILTLTAMIVVVVFLVKSWQEAYSQDLKESFFSLGIAGAALLFFFRMLYSVLFEDEHFNSDL